MEIKNKIRYQLSWSDIKLFLECLRCFYNLKRLGIKRPGLGPDTDLFNVPNAVDELWKKESDLCRKLKINPPIIDTNKIEAQLFDDENHSVQKWRQPHSEGGGIEFYDRDMNLLLFGRVDDVWMNFEQELIIVELKVTSTSVSDANEIKRWHKNNERQVSFYAWLLKKNKRIVSKTGYIIYCNPLSYGFDFLEFNNRLHFKTLLTACKIDDSWIEDAVKEASVCLNQNDAPAPAKNCKFCNFVLKSL